MLYGVGIGYGCDVRVWGQGVGGAWGVGCGGLAHVTRMYAHTSMMHS